MNNRKRLLIAVAAVVMLLLGGGLTYPLVSTLVAGGTESETATKDASYSEILGLVEGGKVTELTFYGQSNAAATTSDGVVHRALVAGWVAADLARQAVAKGWPSISAPSPSFPRRTGSPQRRFSRCSAIC